MFSQSSVVHWTTQDAVQLHLDPLHVPFSLDVLGDGRDGGQATPNTGMWCPGFTQTHYSHHVIRSLYHRTDRCHCLVSPAAEYVLVCICIDYY